MPGAMGTVRATTRASALSSVLASLSGLFQAVWGSQHLRNAYCVPKQLVAAKVASNPGDQGSPWCGAMAGCPLTS